MTRTTKRNVEREVERERPPVFGMPLMLVAAQIRPLLRLPLAVALGA